MLKLDQKDKRLLYEVDLDARQGTSQLGKRIGLSQEGTYYRLQRLQKQKIISDFVTLINFGKIGFTGYGVYTKFQNIDEKKKEIIIKELSKHKNIYWIAEFGGKFDLAFAIAAKSIVEFNEYLLDISTKYHDVLKDFSIAIRVELVQFPRDYLIRTKKPKSKKPSFGKEILFEGLDQTDSKILRELGRNARTSTLELAKRIQKSASSVISRIKKLEQKEVIQGHSALINCQRYGFENYQLFLETHNMNKTAKKRLQTYCQSHPNIIFYIETVGQWNFELIYEIKNQRELQQLMVELRTLFPKIIKNIETGIIFNHNVKYNQYPF